MHTSPTGISRRRILKLGIGVAATSAVGAILAACGGETATTAPAAAPTTAATAAGAAPTVAATATKPAAATTAATTAPTTAAAPVTTGGTSATAAATTAPASAAATTAPTTAAAAASPASTMATAAPAATVAPTPKTAKNANAVKLTWWHAMGGVNGDAVSTLTNQFNDSQSDVFVQDIFQGSYDDNLLKFRNGLQSKALPNLIQMYDIGVRFMVDSKAVEPIQTYINTDKFDLSQFEPALLKYFTVENVQYGMPFNNSNPILYYNKTMFKDAGLNPDQAPRTWDEIAQAATKLTKKDASGKVTMPGIVIAIYSWLFEQWHATQNAVLATPDNGRSARATKLVYNAEAGTKIMDWWKGMVDQGVCGNLGRNSADTQKAFVAGQIPMTIDSTAALRGVVTGVGGKFDVGTGYMPRPAANVDGGGVIIGGAANYIVKDKPDTEKQATWKFVQFLSQAKQQGFWHIGTGYFPVRKDAYDLPEVKANTDKYPQFQTAINQLHDSPVNFATNGATFGTFLQARQDIEGAMESIILGKAKAKDALDAAAATSNTALQMYNASVK